MPAAKSAQKKESTVVPPSKSKAAKQVVESVPVEVAKKESKTKKTTKESVPETVPEVANVVVVSDTESSITSGFTEFITKFQSMLSQFSQLKTELKGLERKTVKELKVVQKLQKKKQKKGTRAPSGFVKPAPISDELASFLGKDKGSEMARTDVTREINKYIRANSLQDKENGRKINPDKALSKLLKIDANSDVVLTYFNLQRYMGPHFPKKVVPVAVQ